MTTVQGNLINHDGNKVAPNTLAAAVYDAAKSQALSATLRDTPDKGALGFPAFLTTDNYATGTVVYYQNKLWRFTSFHSAGAWDSGDVEEYPIKDLVDDLKAGLLDGSLVPALAGNLESWEERDALAVTDTFVDPVRTTAGDTSIVSSAGAKIVSVVALTDFYASALRATGFNLLHGATAVGDGYYFLVPALPWGSYGTAIKPNGILFTNNEGTNLSPTVRFKALASGVPSSVNDGSACPYTDSNSKRFYNPGEAGYLIVSGITLANTCAHVAWSRRYDEFISPTAASDAGSSITLSSIIHAVHSFDRLLTVGSIADRIDFGSTKATWTRRVDRAQLTWANEDNGDGTYTHSATISGMAQGGAVECGNLQLSVSGTTVSYVDDQATGTTDYVKYELATPVTGQVTISPDLSAVEDWGLEVLDGVIGSAYVTMQYAQGYPDSVAALVAGVNYTKLQVLAEAITEISYRLDALEASADRLGNAEADRLSVRDIPMVCGVPLILYAAGVPAAATVPVNWNKETMGEWTGAPCFIGQEYVNTSVNSAGKYYAKGTSAVADWVK